MTKYCLQQARPNNFFAKNQMSQDEFDWIFSLCWFYPVINITAQKPFGFSLSTGKAEQLFRWEPDVPRRIRLKF